MHYSLDRMVNTIQYDIRASSMHGHIEIESRKVTQTFSNKYIFDAKIIFNKNILNE